MVVLCIEVRNKRRKQLPEEYELGFGVYELEASLEHLGRAVSGRLLAMWIWSLEEGWRHKT